MTRIIADISVSLDGNGEAIAREIPGARLLVLQEASTAIPDAAVGEVAEAMLALGQGLAGATRAGRQAARTSAADRTRTLGSTVDLNQA